ncbi:MAG: hypothetical protein KGH75_00470 [Rhodospirillales bacterium]|nr:hypothetical protein [Rhodospirillales bacterium]
MGRPEHQELTTVAEWWACEFPEREPTAETAFKIGCDACTIAFEAVRHRHPGRARVIAYTSDEQAAGIIGADDWSTMLADDAAGA